MIANRILVLFLTSLLLPNFLALSQDKNPPPAKATNNQATFKVRTSIVPVKVNVVDKKGKPVADLKPSDFKVYEDGKLQEIQNFAPEFNESSISTEEKQPDAISSESKPLPDRTRQHRISIVVDDITATGIAAYNQSLIATAKFVENDMVSGDQIALSLGSAFQQYPFSGDKKTLLQEITELQTKAYRYSRSMNHCPPLLDNQAREIATRSIIGETELEIAIQDAAECSGIERNNKTEEMLKSMARQAALMQYEEARNRTRILLETLRNHTRSLKHMNGQKSIVFFSEGFLFEDHINQFQKVIDEALKDGIVFHTISSTRQDTGDLNIQSATGGSTDLRRIVASNNMHAKNDPLFLIANDTGGTFTKNVNDLQGALRKARNYQANYYMLTYAVPVQEDDGKYHKIRVEVSRPNSTLFYRKGYYTLKKAVSLIRQTREDLLDALRAPGDLNEIPMAISHHYTEGNNAEFQVSFLNVIPFEGLQLIEEDSRHKTQIHYVVVAFDEQGKYVNGLGKQMEFNLTDEAYAELLQLGMPAEIAFKLPPGNYKIKAMVREGTLGKMGSTTLDIEIP